jgi:hypothetical protein
MDFNFPTIRDEGDGKNVVFRGVADTIADEKGRVMPWSLENLKLCRVIAITVSSLRVIFHLDFTRTITRHHSLHNNPHTFATLCFKAINAAGKSQEISTKKDSPTLQSLTLNLWLRSVQKGTHYGCCGTQLARFAGLWRCSQTFGYILDHCQTACRLGTNQQTRSLS